MTPRYIARSAAVAVAAAALILGGATAAAADPTDPVTVGDDGTAPLDPTYDGPQVTQVRVVEEGGFLEISWDRYVDELAAVSAEHITLRNGDRVVPLVPKGAGSTDTIFFDKDNRQIAATAADSMARLPDDLHLSSIRIDGSIDPALPLTVEIDGTAITDTDGRAARSETYAGVSETSYYSQRITTDAGIVVKAGPRVSTAALQLAAAQVETQLSLAGTGIAETMAENSCSLAVYGARENAYLVPEHRRGYNPEMYDVEGYGGNMWNNCVSSISERNVLRTRGDDNPFLNTSYPNENILVHEFGHAVLSVGIEEQDDQTLSDEFFAAYENAYTTGRWPNTYAMSNRDEFFATLSTIWFDNMAEKPDWNDGVRSPINTRAELKEYDPVAYAFFASIYPADAPMPAPWDEPGPDIHHGDYREEPQLPPRASATEVDYAADTFRIITDSVGAEYQLDRYAGDADHPERDVVSWTKWGDGVWKLSYGDGAFTIAASDGSGVLSSTSDTEVAYVGIERDAADPRQRWMLVGDAGTVNNMFDGQLVNEATGRALALDGRPGNGTSLVLREVADGTRWMLENTSRTSAQGIDAYLQPVGVTVRSGDDEAVLHAPQQGFALPSIDDVAGADWTRPGERFAGWALDGSTTVLPADWAPPADTTELTLDAVWEPDTTRPEVTLVSPSTSGPLQALDIRVDATDDAGLVRIVANISRDGTLVRSTQTRVDGSLSATHAQRVDLPDGTYVVKYNAHDVAGNVSRTASFTVTIDATAPTATVKSGSSFTSGDGTVYDLVSFKLHDAGKVDRVEINGVVKDLTDNTWSDVNFIRAGALGAVAGVNTMTVHDVAGNTSVVEFTLR